ncbi:LytTr DNA-binding region [Emticicia oligotrophica DSM 17448]|uniref:LytTr DNA-binding region n=1 Tax=Emticicia oligotrophica (strain DSM 17448 / CIP 109782 / MTCC 6937 / GPTSA100-15) TaxID=929562 RepID=A0ABN4APX7_EMTOG|nr:LytTR family DNA-binding domain-containing protein [Emticicia oligotrophica]AFK04453.1 LytTr DNA-binding region [Emticicia oligotrophica DSM 17448]
MKTFFTRPNFCDPKLIWFNHGKICIQPDEVVYLSSLENYTEFHLSCGRKVVSSRTLKTHETDLINKGHFARVHRKFMLNLRYLKHIERQGEEHIAHLTTGDKIVVSRRKARSFSN